jgi:hypothetical protein
MTTLIVPAAGFSTRFNLGRPKMLLQHPSGVTMLTAAIGNLANQLNGKNDQVIIIMKKDFFVDLSVEKLQNELDTNINVKTKIILLNHDSSSMVESIISGIRDLEVDDSIIIKDSDNFIDLNLSEFNKYENAIAAFSISGSKIKNISNKSFLIKNEEDHLINIFEKQIKSDLINLGLVKFEKASDFIKYAKLVQSQNEIYVSDVLKKAVEDNQIFKIIVAKNFEDWGTQEDWLDYLSKYSTLFVDLDGVCCINENPLSKNGGWNSFIPIKENISVLLGKQETGKVKIVFTTSRSENYRNFVTNELLKSGFINFELITGLPHATRILINDFSKTNVFPSAQSINLPRNSKDLEDYLD